MRVSRDEWAIEMAKLTATRSTCLRRHVGCVFLNSRGHVLATGYNGVAAGQPHCNDTKLVEPDCKVVNRYAIDDKRVDITEPQKMITVHPHACSGAKSPSGTNLDGCQAIHAEQNALLQCRDIYEIDTCYVTASPCMTCTKLLLNTSCQRIVFLEEYPHTEARELWESAGRKWEKFSK